jgi:cytoskeleton protein RodZ
MADSEQPAAPEPEPPPPSATLGETLRVARLAQDLTIEQIATELRIEAKQLAALENNRFEQIGVPVFVKGYLKQYGLRLGLDPRDLLVLYYAQTTLGDVQIQPNRTIKLRDERQRTTWIVAIIVLLAVVAGLAVWWWNGASFGIASSTSSAPAATPPVATQRAEPVPPPAAAPEAAPRETAPAADAPASPAADALPSSAAPAVESGDREPAPADGAAFVAPDEGSDEETPGASAATVPLQFAFDGESWAEVTDARGERLLFGLSQAGRNVTVRGVPPFSILLGDANAVRLTVDGEAYEIPTARRQGNLARFTVDVAEE